MSADLIEAGAPRCPDCGMPEGMHHDPGCSRPCGACKTAARRARARWWLLFLFTFTAGAALGTAVSLSTWALTGFDPVWFAVLLDFAGLFAAAGAIDLTRVRRKRLAKP